MQACSNSVAIILVTHRKLKRETVSEFAGSINSRKLSVDKERSVSGSSYSRKCKLYGWRGLTERKWWDSKVIYIYDWSSSKWKVKDTRSNVYNN